MPPSGRRQVDCGRRRMSDSAESSTSAGSAGLVLRALTQTAPLHSRAEVLRNPSCVPTLPGFYGWYFREIPQGVPVAGCVVRDGWTLLYVGIAPRTASSRRSLRTRLKQHLRGNASASTLRLSLGCLSANRLGLELRRTASGNRLTFGPGEQVLSAWLEQHARVVVTPTPTPWYVEAQIVRAIPLPLNLEHNAEHAFAPVLAALRSQARHGAAALPSWSA